jgi:molybdopterin converting factor subunit 1
VTIHLLYFGVLKDHFAADRDLLELPEPATVRDLLAQLQSRGTADQPLWKSLAVAVNRDYATPETPLHDGDEVALLPPVSGGSTGDPACA